MPHFYIADAMKTAPGFTFNGMDVDEGLSRRILNNIYANYIDLGCHQFVSGAIKAARTYQKEHDDRALRVIYDAFGEGFEEKIKEFGAPDYVSALCILKNGKFVPVEL